METGSGTRAVGGLPHSPRSRYSYHHNTNIQMGKNHGHLKIWLLWLLSYEHHLISIMLLWGGWGLKSNKKHHMANKITVSQKYDNLGEGARPKLWPKVKDYLLLLCDNNGWFHSLQLAEIRRVKLSSILCDNSDDIENIQVLILMMTVMILFETWKTTGHI